MSLNLLTSALKIAGRNAMSIQAWSQSEDLRAAKVARFRSYADGDHDNNMTVEMRNLLNQRNRNAEDSHEFNDNLCAVILDTMLDRIQLTDVKADAGSDDANDWVNDLLERNRIDALQVDVHESALRDGNSFLMTYPDPETGDALWAHEPAYDGAFGTIVMYETTASRDPLLAIKVWRITSTEIADTVRVNVYYPDRIERFASKSVVSPTGGTAVTSLEEYSGDEEPAVIPWLAKDGTPLGVPFVHFRNRGGSVDNFGLSELENVIPLQDALNGTMVSMVATTLLTGFPIRALIGALAPAAVAPGLTLSFYGKDTSGNPTNPTDVVNEWLKTIRLEQFDAAPLEPFIAQAQWLKQEMFAVTNTPTDDVAADASGEARKQSEVKLIGKVKRFCVRNGNAWEDAVRMAARVASAFLKSDEPVPDFEDLTAVFADAEIRNDSKTQADVLALWKEGLVPQKAALKLLQPIYDWTNDEIDQFVVETDQAKNASQINAADAAAVEKLLSGANMPPDAQNGVTTGMPQREGAAMPQRAMNGANGDDNPT